MKVSLYGGSERPVTGVVAFPHPAAGTTRSSRQEREMNIRFECMFEGKSLFQVFRGEENPSLFTGTRAQCQRFLEVYEDKVRKARFRDRRSAGRGLHISRVST